MKYFITLTAGDFNFSQPVINTLHWTQRADDSNGQRPFRPRPKQPMAI